MQQPIYEFVFAPAWRYLFPTVVPEEFTFTSDSEVPFASGWSVFCAMAVYYLFVHGGQYLFRSKSMPTFPLKALFFVHNCILSTVSALLLALIVENLAPRAYQHGLMWAMCHGDALEADHRLELFFYLNYMCKFYEFFDTLFLVVRKKNVEFLHWFHHSMTMLLCYTELIGRTTGQWVPIVMNLIVHVLMYYYYARTSISSKPIWWKKYLTTMQITQFIIDLLFINFALYTVIQVDADQWFHMHTGLHLPVFTWSTFGMGVNSKTSLLLAGKTARCYGSYKAGLVGWALINSYLLLFVQFFRKTYNDKKAAKSPSKKKYYEGKSHTKKE